MHTIESVCVYAGAASTALQRYHNLASEFGHILATEKVTLVYGGGNTGVIGTLANACLDNGGQVIGVLPEFLYEAEGVHAGLSELSELHIVSSLHERKQQMFERADGFVIMPGAFGTLDEAFEIITWRQLGLHAKPIVFVNAFGYWDSLLTQLLPHMMQEGLLKAADRQSFELCDQPKAILPTLRQVFRGNTDFVGKWG